MPRRTAFFVSDQTGVTAETMGHSLLTQFDGLEFRQVTLPFISSIDKAEEAVRKINATAIADGAISEGLDPASVDVVSDREAALVCLLAALEDGDSVLVKASRGAELDLLVDRLAQAAGVGDGNA